MASGNDDGASIDRADRLQLAAERRKAALRCRVEREIQFAVIAFRKIRPSADCCLCAAAMTRRHVRARPGVAVGQRMHALANALRDRARTRRDARPRPQRRFAAPSTRATSCRHRRHVRAESVRARRSPCRRSGAPAFPLPPLRADAPTRRTAAARRSGVRAPRAADCVRSPIHRSSRSARRRAAPAASARPARPRRPRRARRCTDRARARARSRAAPKQTREIGLRSSSPPISIALSLAGTSACSEPGIRDDALVERRVDRKIVRVDDPSAAQAHTEHRVACRRRPIVRKLFIRRIAAHRYRSPRLRSGGGTRGRRHTVPDCVPAE